MSQIQRSVGSRPCRTEMFPPITVRTRVPTTPYPHLRQSPHPHQFAISCPIYLCVYEPIYIRIIVFVWNFYKPEHYRCSLMRTLRDVDLHRSETPRRRHVELPNPVVHILSVTHQYRVPTTHRTNTCLQSHQWNHHNRDCLYNIRHNTEHKYINLVCLREWHVVNINRTPWAAVPSLPIPDTTYPKKEPLSPPRIRHYRIPHSPK